MSNYNKLSTTPYKNTSYKTTDSYDTKTSINSKDSSVNRNSIVPAYSRPLTGMEEDNNGGTTWYPSARPIKHWRKQLNPRLGSGVNGRRAGIGMSMDIPAGSTILGNTADCINTSECTLTSTISTDNILRPVSCNASCNIIKPASTIISKKYYPDRKAYLQSRCLLFNQKLSGNKIQGITYWNTTTNTPILPSNDLINGTQNRATKNCLNCPDTTISNTNTTIYKPNNYQYATQGAVDSSSRIARLKYNTITKNGNSMKTAFGNAGANAAALYNGSNVSPYLLKNKNNIVNCADYHRNGKKTVCPTINQTYYSPFNANNPITNQAQLNLFRGVVLIVGDIYIDGFDGQPDFSVFDALMTIVGNIHIENNSGINSIIGFGIVTSICGYIFIDNNINVEIINICPLLVTLGCNTTTTTNLQRNLVSPRTIITDGYIEITNNALLETITGFNNLTTMNSYFYIDSNPSLTTISEFPNLRTIGDLFYIVDNTILETINGFNNLTTISSYFSIESNPNLTTINGFEKLETIEGFSIIDSLNLNSINNFPKLTTVSDIFIIINNANLEVIPSFNELTTIGGDFTIAGNDSLVSISDFSGLTVVGGDFDIYTNPYLTTINGFNELTTIGNEFNIYDNNTLTDISGFNALISVSGEIYINDNTLLETISGFTSLETIGSNFYIYDNISLTTIPSFNELKTIGLDFDMEGNNSLTDISGFTSLQTIGGYLGIYESNSLTTINGFTSLETIGGYFAIRDDNSLNLISGFTALTPMIGIGGIVTVVGSTDVSTNIYLATQDAIANATDPSTNTPFPNTTVI